MGFPVLCSLKGLFLRFYEPKICNYLYAKQKEKSILILMVCYFLTIFYIISNWYYFDGFNIAVNFYLEDKINKTKSTQTQNISFVYWKCKISLITFFLLLSWDQANKQRICSVLIFRSLGQRSRHTAGYTNVFH